MELSILTREEIREIIREEFEYISRDFSKSIIKAISSIEKQEPEKELMNLAEFVEYLPEKPANQTVYCWVNAHKVPYEKIGKKLFFRKSDIDEWIKNGRKISIEYFMKK